MNLTEELRNLAELYQEGHLTKEEFSDAKRRLISENNQQPICLSENQENSETFSECIYRSSRWSSGNLFFPDRLTLSKEGIVFQKGSFFSSSEELISYRAVASIRIENGFFLSNITIETSGGSQPIFINGLWKSEAKDIQDSIWGNQQKLK